MIKINESITLSSSEVDKLVKSGDLDGLVTLLAKQPDDTTLIPKNSKYTYHKASNGVKSGWVEYHIAKRVNVTLYSDLQLAKILMNNK